MEPLPQTTPRYSRSERRTWFHWIYTLEESPSWTYHSLIPCPGLRDRLAMGCLTLERTDAGTDLTFQFGTWWNGATGAPDFKAVIVPTLIHDIPYRHLRELALMLAVSVATVREWADDVFKEAMRAYGFKRSLKRLYYAAVRWVGWLFA